MPIGRPPSAAGDDPVSILKTRTIEFPWVAYRALGRPDELVVDPCLASLNQLLLRLPKVRESGPYRPVKFADGYPPFVVATKADLAPFPFRKEPHSFPYRIAEDCHGLIVDLSLPGPFARAPRVPPPSTAKKGVRLVCTSCPADPPTVFGAATSIEAHCVTDHGRHATREERTPVP